MEKNPHKAHRMRMKQRFLATGFDGMAEHEILELALYYTIPFRDTNPIAHELLRQFGSINQIVKTDPAYLKQVKGVGENTALFFRFLKSFLEYYEAHTVMEHPSLSTCSDAKDYVIRQLRYRDVEHFLMLSLDAQMRLIRCDILSRGTVGQTEVNLRKLVEHAMKFNALAVILAHNHPSGTAQPTTDDDLVTEKLQQALGLMGIRLLDHFVVAGEDVYSYFQSGKLSQFAESLSDHHRATLAQNPARFREEIQEPGEGFRPNSSR